MYQANIHQDVLFAKNFFKAGVWENEFAGVDSTSVSGKQFIKFSNGNSDPISFIEERATDVRLYGADFLWRGY